MDDIKLALDAINLYQAQYSQVDKLWGYFSVVSLAIAGFAIGGEKIVKTFKESLAVVFTYIVFCIGNHEALVAGQKQLEEIASIAIALSTKAGLDVSSLKPISHGWISTFHISVITAACIGVLSVAWFRKTSQNNPLKCKADKASVL